MAGDLNALLHPVADYYTQKLLEHGASPQGTDWNSADGQSLRFEQLCKVIANTENVSVGDLGCGYGALLDYLQTHYSGVDYSGVDVSEAMINAARKAYPGAKFHLGEALPSPVDYTLASGIFNVRLGADDTAWLAYIHHTLDVMHESSRLGFAFNCLTSYSDPEYMREYLYYTDPCALFDHCKRRYSRQVALLHDYGLYEFTILVRKA